MRSPTLRIGEPAVLDGPPLPIESARVQLHGSLFRFLIAYHEPTDAEVSAIESGAVELGIYHDDGLAAVAARIGNEGESWLIETRAPLILLDVPAHIDGAKGVPPPQPDGYHAELVLCDTNGGLVCALRHLRLPASIVQAVRRVAHVQATRFGSLATAIRAHERALRSHTVRELMQLAAVRARIANGSTGASPPVES